MFSSRERLPRDQFPAVLKAGRRYVSPHFTLITAIGTRGYAVVISKKIARLSTARHRFKRQILEALRTAPLPASLVILARAPLGSMSYQDIKVELEEVISKIHS